MKDATRSRIRRLIPFLILVGLTLTALPVSAGVGVWTSHGPTDVGWVNDLAIADSVAYAATLNGVFRSYDRGASWQQSGLEGESIFQIVARPGAAIVLAATYGYDETLYASRDGGGTWSLIPGLPSVTAAAIDPGHLSTLYAGATDGMIWKSADAGASWQQLSPIPGGDGAWPLTFAFDSRAIFLLTYSKLFKSLDGGVSWTLAQPPLGFPSSIATGAAAGVVYAAAGGYLCRSADSATTWTCPTNYVPGGVFRIVEVPGDGPTATPRLLVSSSEGVFLSSDVGETWTPVAGGLESASQPALASDASGSLVLAGTDTQVFRTEDRGDSWASSSAGLKSVWISALTLDPQNPSTVWAGGIGNWQSGPGLFRSTDAGLSWSPAGGPQGPRGVNAMAIDPANPSTMYAGSSETIFRTGDGGLTWASSLPAAPGQGGVNVIALDPDASQRVWVGGPGLFRSDDGARTWQAAPVAQAVFSVLFDDRHPGTIYAGSYWDVDFDYYSSYGGSIFVSHDGGATFSKGTHYFGSAVLSIAQDPFQDGLLYVAAGNAGVFRSADGGVTWESASAGLPQVTIFISFYTTVLEIVADPVRPGRLYCSTLDGVFRTTDGAQTWQLFSQGLAPLATSTLVISPDGRKLYAGTAGGGVFDYQISPGILDLSVGSDNRTRLLWTDIDGRIELRSLDGSGALVSSASYGQYTGWSARAVADGSDGLTRVLWNNPDGSTGLQLLGPTGDQVSDYRYGRVGSWAAADVSVDPDNTTHLLWTNADGRMGLGSLDGSGALVNGPSYGPYNGWVARSIAHGADGLTRVLWTRTDGTVGLSFFGAGGIFATHRFEPVSGPASGWTARDIAVASDNKTRILWGHSDGRMTLWSVDNSGAVTSADTVYVPTVSGQALRISAGADGLTRVLWTSPGGTGTLWLLGLDNVFQSSFGLN